jgi:hypothetical protein
VISWLLSDNLQKIVKKDSFLLAIIVVLLAVVVGGGGLFLYKSGGFSLPGAAEGEKTTTPAKASGYVAVFLTNNQVYFGKLANMAAQYPALTDVYYLRVQQALATGEGNVQVETKTAAAGTARNELTLIKLGDELHGPTDEISLNRDHILLIEDLKEDSKVVKAIQQFKNKK